jgi:hypothetical protein
MVQLLDTIADDPVLSRYLSPEDGGPDNVVGWMDQEARVPDELVAFFEELVTIHERWANRKGEPELLSQVPSMVPTPVVISLIREIQMRRSIELLEGTETFNL